MDPTRKGGTWGTRRGTWMDRTEISHFVRNDRICFDGDKERLEDEDARNGRNFVVVSRSRQ
jgi:hypothetical protein